MHELTGKQRAPTGSFKSNNKPKEIVEIAKKSNLEIRTPDHEELADDELEACREVDDLNIKCEEGDRWSVPYC